MLAPSFNLVPVAPVESARSLPARSTKLIFIFTHFYILMCTIQSNKCISFHY
jgi:hypothetical protein